MKSEVEERVERDDGTHGVEKVGLGAVVSSEQKIGNGDGGYHRRPPH